MQKPLVSCQNLPKQHNYGFFRHSRKKLSLIQYFGYNLNLYDIKNYNLTLIRLYFFMMLDKNSFSIKDFLYSHLIVFLMYDDKNLFHIGITDSNFKFSNEKYR